VDAQEGVGGVVEVVVAEGGEGDGEEEGGEVGEFLEEEGGGASAGGGGEAAGGGRGDGGGVGVDADGVVGGGGEGAAGVEFAPAAVEAGGAQKVVGREGFVGGMGVGVVGGVIVGVNGELGFVDGFGVAAMAEGADGRLGLEALAVGGGGRGVGAGIQVRGGSFLRKKPSFVRFFAIARPLSPPSLQRQNLPIPRQPPPVQLVPPEKTRRPRPVVVPTLQMKHGRITRRVDPLAHQRVGHGTRLPIALVAVIGAEDDEEGDGRDEDADGVGVVQEVVVFEFGGVEGGGGGAAAGVVDGEVQDYGEEAGEEGLGEGGAVPPEEEVGAVGASEVFDHGRRKWRGARRVYIMFCGCVAGDEFDCRKIQSTKID